MLKFFRRKKQKDPKLPKSELPKVRGKTFPGPRSVKLTESLKRFECPQITYVGGSFPVFFTKAHAANIWDVDGNRYLDLTSCFGVVNLGHSDRAVTEAIRRQAGEMMHGLGDIHPHALKVELAQRLSEITPGNLSQTIFSSTGAEAVESALKTAVMATGKTGIVAFENAYHGLSYGALNATHREDFKKPFQKQLGKHVSFAPFPDTRVDGSKATELSIKAVQKIIARSRRSQHRIGAVLVEPIQGRGGIQTPPNDFLQKLRALCDEEKILLIADEVFTGFGRTGSLFAVEKSGVVPDLLCVGKGIANGFPLSACIGSARVMHTWGVSTGESLHTSTFLGTPLGSAAALAVIREIETKKYVERSRLMGEIFRRELHKLKERYGMIGDIRGSGLMIGVELVESNLALAPARRKTGKKSKKSALPPAATAKTRLFIEEALKSGVILLSSGPESNVLSITPPFVISEREIQFCVALFEKILKKIA